MNKKTKSDKLDMKIEATFGFLGPKKSKIVAAISWDGAPEKLNIRSCFRRKDSPELIVGKGVSLEEDELRDLRDLLNTMDDSGHLPEIDSSGRKEVNFSDIFGKAENIVEKRESGYVTEDGFIKLQPKASGRYTAWKKEHADN